MSNPSPSRASTGGGDQRFPKSEPAPKGPIDAIPANHRLTLSVNVTQQFVGAVPGGHRIDLYYSGTRTDTWNPIVVPDGSEFQETVKEYLAAASILSGNDWVTFTSEAVLDFDSRVTIALVEPYSGVSCPVAGRLRGRAHLRDLRKRAGARYFGRNAPAAEIFAAWATGFDEGSYLPLVLSASFDVPQRGFDEQQTKVYQKSRELSNGLFIGLGSAVYRRAPYGAVKHISLDLYALDTDSVELPAELSPNLSFDAGLEGDDG
jgi:hypothetical protein